MSGFQFPNHGNLSCTFRTNKQEKHWRLLLSLLSPYDPTPASPPSSHTVLKSERGRGKWTSLASVALIPTAGSKLRILKKKTFHQAHDPT